MDVVFWNLFLYGSPNYNHPYTFKAALFDDGSIGFDWFNLTVPLPASAFGMGDHSYLSGIRGHYSQPAQLIDQSQLFSGNSVVAGHV